MFPLPHAILVLGPVTGLVVVVSDEEMTRMQTAAERVSAEISLLIFFRLLLKVSILCGFLMNAGMIAGQDIYGDIVVLAAPRLLRGIFFATAIS
jgi:hypothetical protein